MTYLVCGNVLSKSHGIDRTKLPTLPYDVFGLWFQLQVQRACNWVVVTLNMRQACPVHINIG